MGAGQMKAVYVSHPLRGAVQRNFNAVSDICQNLKAIYPDLLILSPIHAFSFESVTAPQEWVLWQCLRLIGKRVINMTDGEEAEANEAILRRLGKGVEFKG